MSVERLGDYMKRYLKLVLGVIVFLMVICLFESKVNAQALDQIEEYRIIVEPQKDGTLNMTYHIEWTVLDSNTEGPLTWVEIGIPNSNVKARKIPNTIKGISIPSKVGNYVRIDFKKAYYAGETVSFDFSLEEVRMYQLQNSNNLLIYDFTPGWFDNIEVKNITVMWKADNVKSHNGKISGDYITWNGNLKPGKKLAVKVTYTASYFDIKPEKNTSYSILTSNGGMIIFGIIFFLIFVIYIYAGMFAPYYYYRHRGYGYYGYGGHHHHHYGGFGGGGHRRIRRSVAEVGGGRRPEAVLVLVPEEAGQAAQKKIFTECQLLKCQECNK